MSSFFLLHGLLEEISLAEVARFLHATSRTGLLGITSGNEAGAIYFSNGTVMDFESQYLSGVDALDQIASFKLGKFEWFGDVLAPSDSLRNIPTSDLIQHFENQIQIARLEQGIPTTSEAIRGASVPRQFDFAHSAEAPIETPDVTSEEDSFQDRSHPLAKTDKLPFLDSPVVESRTPHPLSGIKAQELVQVFCLNGRDVRLTIVSQCGIEGEICIWRGRLYDAIFGELTGDHAFYEMVMLEHPRLMIEELTEEPGVSVTSTWEHLLMEAAMKQDLKVEGRAG